MTMPKVSHVRDSNVNSSFSVIPILTITSLSTIEPLTSDYTVDLLMKSSATRFESDPLLRPTKALHGL